MTTEHTQFIWVAHVVDLPSDLTLFSCGPVWVLLVIFLPDTPSEFPHGAPPLKLPGDMSTVCLFSRLLGQAAWAATGLPGQVVWGLGQCLELGLVG